MRPEYYQDRWKEVSKSRDPEQIRSLAHRVAANFLERYFYSDEYNESYIDLLCRMATCYSDPALDQITSKILFSTVIERLCDDFEELQTETYNRVICQITGFLRTLAGGSALHQQLNKLQLVSHSQLYERIESIRLGPDEKLQADIKPRKILVLSRITIGADVAITTVITQRLALAFPAAEIVVLGNGKLEQVFGPAAKVRIREVDYARHGGLLERFNTWLSLFKDVEEELNGLGENEYVLLDPDSRLTQLGVLPLIPNSNYRFFNSRGKKEYPPKASISELTNLWLDNILGQGEFSFPRVWLQPQPQQTASSLFEKLGDKHRVVTLNFGVGGNHRKMVPGSFESRLVVALLRQPATRIILDMGFGEEELQRSTTILAAVKMAGFKVSQTTFSLIDQLPSDFDLLGVQCSVGEIAALIEQSDEFIGYDSACQHIAAALGVKTYTVFAGTNNVKFIRRWHACGPNTSEILFVDTLTRDTWIDDDELIDRLLDLRQS
ncbi:MAG: glycosyltransferase family 9 protein [Pseudohongiellaceae bacterium]